MPNSAIHVNQPLSNISIKYRNTDYIADDIGPKIQVKKEVDLYYVHNTNFRLAETLRANGAPSNQITWGVSTASYKLNRHALKDILTDRDRANADAAVQAEMNRTEELTDQIMLRNEKECEAVLFTTTTFSNNTTYTTTATQSWKTSTVFPTKDIISATSVIKKSSAKHPNTMVMGQSAYDTVRENSNVYGRIQYVERAIVTEDVLAALFDIDRVMVGSGIIDSDKTGLSESTDYIWGDNVFLGYIAPRPGMRTPSALYKFEQGSRYVKKWRDDLREGDWLEVNQTYQFKSPATACGYLIKSVSL